MPVKLFIINMILLISLGFTCFRIYATLNPEEQTSFSPSIEDFILPTKTDKKLRKSNAFAASFYRVIVNHNIFSPERKPPVVEDGEDNGQIKSVQRVKLTENKIFLYGVFISDSGKMALINNPVVEDENKQYRWVQENDCLGTILIDRIEKEAIYISEGKKSYKIGLYTHDGRVTKKAAEESMPTIIVTDQDEETGIDKKEIKPSKEALPSNTKTTDATKNESASNKSKKAQYGKNENGIKSTSGQKNDSEHADIKPHSSKGDSSKIFSNPFRSFIDKTKGKK